MEPKDKRHPSLMKYMRKLLLKNKQNKTKRKQGNRQTNKQGKSFNYGTLIHSVSNLLLSLIQNTGNFKRYLFRSSFVGGGRGYDDGIGGKREYGNIADLRELGKLWGTRNLGAREPNT